MVLQRRCHSDTKSIKYKQIFNQSITKFQLRYIMQVATYLSRSIAEEEN